MFLKTSRGLLVAQNRAEFGGRRSVCLEVSQPGLWAGQTHITHLPRKVPSPSLQLQWCEAFGLVERWELRSPLLWQAERQIMFWSLSLLQLVSSYLLPNASISSGVEHLLSFENLISIMHKSPSLIRTMTGLVLSPMIFQDGEEVRNVPDPTTIKYIPGELSGHVCSTEVSPDSVGQVHPEKLSTAISTQGWGGPGWGSWSWLSPKKALSCVNQIQPGEHWGQLKCRHLSWFGLVWMLHLWSETELQQNSTAATKSFCYSVPNPEQGLSFQLSL